MSFFSVLFALLLEQLKPLPRNNPIHHALVGFVAWVGRNFDAGKPHHAWVVWGLSVVAPSLLVFGLWWGVRELSLVAAWVFNVAVLYLTLGFRQFSHFFTDIRDALARGDEERARALLAEWRHLDTSELPRTALLRHVVEHALLAAHRHVFGVFFWFVLLAALGFGPLGAVFYRLAEFSRRYWRFRLRAFDTPGDERLFDAARRAFNVIDHVPARMTAFGFAVVGNFEEALRGWRRDAVLWTQSNDGIVLASAAGAVGLQLGGHATPERAFASGLEPDDARGGRTPGASPQLAHLQSVVALVWRSVILWMLLLALLTLANVVG